MKCNNEILIFHDDLFSVLFLACLYICVREFLLQNNIHMSEVHCGSAVRLSQALPGYFITAQHLYACLM